MKWLNYNHLHYFWVVAREGGVVRASEELLVSQPTISNQLKELEARSGTGCSTAWAGGLGSPRPARVAFNYANEIFSLGPGDAERTRAPARGQRMRLAAGVGRRDPQARGRGSSCRPRRSSSSPSASSAARTSPTGSSRTSPRERIDLVLSDAPIGTAVQVEGYNHLLGESGVSFFADAGARGPLPPRVPQVAERAPTLLPSDHTQVRRSLNAWFDTKCIHPVVAGEFDDSALMFWFGRTGHGVFPAPTVIEADIRREMGLSSWAACGTCGERFYAITLEEKPKHPAVVAICSTRLGKR